MPHQIHVSPWASRLLLAGGLLLVCSAAEAQVRYVAWNGNDANPCTSTAMACRTLQRGINSAPSGGEVKLLSSVDGDATINRPLTISGDGFTLTGSIVVNNANAAIVLRDLHLYGTGRNVGIQVTSAGSVHIERCTVERFADHAIVSSAPDVELFVIDSVVRDNGGPGITVYDANAGPTDIGSMTLSVDGSRVENNGHDGFLLSGVGGATISNTIVSGNHANGINLSYGAASVVSTTASQNGAGGFNFYEAQVVVNSSTASGNDGGLYALGGDVTISSSTLTNNEVGILTNDWVRTRGDNTVSGNTTNVDGTLIPLPGM
jgi:hypothetical protein